MRLLTLTKVCIERHLIKFVLFLSFTICSATDSSDDDEDKDTVKGQAKAAKDAEKKVSKALTKEEKKAAAQEKVCLFISAYLPRCFTFFYHSFTFPLQKEAEKAAKEAAKQAVKESAKGKKEGAQKEKEKKKSAFADFQAKLSKAATDQPKKKGSPHKDSHPSRATIKK